MTEPRCLNPPDAQCRHSGGSRLRQRRPIQSGDRKRVGPQGGGRAADLLLRLRAGRSSTDGCGSRDRLSRPARYMDNPSRAAAAMQGVWNAKAAAALKALLARLPGENTIVHVHGWAKALSPSVGPAIRAAGHPAVYTMHEYFLACPNGGFYNYQSEEICKLPAMSAACWATNCNSRNYPFKLWRNGRLLVAQATGLAGLQGFRADFRPSGRASCCLSAKGRRDASRVQSRRGRAARAKSRSGRGEILFVGRLSAEKGALLFAEAAEAANVTPVFIGDGPIATQLREKHPRARLLGWREPPMCVRRCAPPGRWRFPRCGTRELGAHRAGGQGDGDAGDRFRRLRRAGTDRRRREGLWFRSGDFKSLAAALERLKDDALVARLSSARLRPTGAIRRHWRAMSKRRLQSIAPCSRGRRAEAARLLRIFEAEGWLLRHRRIRHSGPRWSR